MLLRYARTRLILRIHHNERKQTFPGSSLLFPRSLGCDWSVIGDVSVIGDGCVSRVNT